MAGRDRSVRLYDVSLPAARWQRTAHGDRVTSVAFSPGNSNIASAGHDGRIVLWDVPSGRRLSIIQSARWTYWSVAFGAEGRTLAASTGGGDISLWDLVDQATPRRVAMPAEGREGSLSADGRRFAAFEPEGRKISVWDLAQSPPKILRSFAVRVGDPSPGHSISPDGLTLAIADGTLRLASVESGAEHVIPTLFLGPCQQLAFSSDGTVLGLSTGAIAAYRTNKCSVTLWETATRKQIFRKEAESAGRFALSADGRRMALTLEKGRIALWNVADSQIEREIAADANLYSAIKLSADGQSLLSNQGNHTRRLWDCHTGRTIRKLPMGSGESACFSHDGKTLATADRVAITLWNIATGARLDDVIKAEEMGEFGWLMFAANDNALAGWISRDQQSGELLFWDANTLGSVETNSRISSRTRR
jgi:WD40 repeat protein